MKIRAGIGTFSSLGMLALMASASAQTVVAPDFMRYERPFDESRGVLSYAEIIRDTYPSIVRINFAAQASGGGSSATGNGSGVIFDVEQGLILTNAHVVDGATKIGLELFDGRLVDAELVGMDKQTDLAVLRAKVPGTESAVFVDSQTLQVGDVVFAIGFPRGLDRTVSMGVISGLNRQGFYDPSSDAEVEDFIQTDAAINPGNSGGPLFDSQGRVVGINTWILRESDGLGFAVPSTTAVEVARQLAENGRMRRGRMGIGFETLTSAKAEALGVQVDAGALVTSVSAGSAAEAAGLKVEDVITGAGERQIKSGNDLVNFALLADLDENHRLFVHRGGDVLRLQIRLTPIDPEPGTAPPESRTAPPDDVPVAPSIFGAELANASGGVRVTSVADGSPAAGNNLKVGDVIIELNGEAVSDARLLVDAIAALNDEVAALRIRRGDTEFLTLFTVG